MDFRHLRKTGKKSLTNIRCRSCDREPKPESSGFLWSINEENVPNEENPDVNLIEFNDATATL